VRQERPVWVREIKVVTRIKPCEESCLINSAISSLAKNNSRSLYLLFTCLVFVRRFHFLFVNWRWSIVIWYWVCSIRRILCPPMSVYYNLQENEWIKIQRRKRILSTTLLLFSLLQDWKPKFFFINPIVFNSLTIYPEYIFFLHCWLTFSFFSLIPISSSNFNYWKLLDTLCYYNETKLDKVKLNNKTWWSILSMLL
jgi:hypothetical protein